MAFAHISLHAELSLQVLAAKKLRMTPDQASEQRALQGHLRQCTVSPMASVSRIHDHGAIKLFAAWPPSDVDCGAVLVLASIGWELTSQV
jgi:hypothetical protein